ncbi:MAG: DUF2723 domain-containing protein [candidate division Zixibacteria bacterium]|nr:DUF2723 domain-containing protein [candidate division Zixibacteria bacterium]
MQQNTTNLKIIYYAGAVFALVLSFIVFFKTMAPTLSFWDCGEFIACSHILGVPHPPGTPLYILLGRFFILLGFLSTPALSTNLLSVLSSALTVMMAYIIIVRVAEKIIFNNHSSHSDPLLSKLGIYVGALSGSLILAFSSTFWFNAVETEVYGASMLLMTIITYMALVWSEKKATGGNDILLIGIVYLLFLSIGIHLTVFLIVPALVAFIVLVDKTKLRDWRFWVSWGILFSFAMPVYLPIQLIIPSLMDVQIETWMFLMVGFAAFCGYMTFNRRAKDKRGWSLYFAIMVVAIIGFTPHIYIPIRAAQKPAINENNPDNWVRVKAYLERKQYGQESMVTRMLPRRAQLKNQFGNYPHMGFWGYFKEQYSNEIWGLLRYLPFLFGLFGMFISLRKSFKNGFLLAAIFLIGSVGLILYLNFADGTKADHLEVRDRDYFFTPGFIFFAILIGVGFSTLLSRILAWCNNRVPAWSGFLIWAAALILILVMPLDTLTYHYRAHDRTGDFAPPDYAYNILNSCDENGIIFTNGDNDTFPLWYLQEVENVRKDVRVVNLSLLNTDWYIMQLKDQMNVPITLTDKQILWKPLDRRGQITLYRPEEPFYDPIRGKNRYLAAYQDSRSGKVVRVQDQMIEHIVISNKWQYPIYFSTSVPVSNRWTLNDFTVRRAMALEITPQRSNDNLDPVRTEELIRNVYSYRGVDDINVFKDENNVGLTTTYPERFIELADYHTQKGDTVKAKEILLDAINRFPIYYQSYINLINLYNLLENPDSSQVIYDIGVENIGKAVESWPSITLYHQFLGELHFANNEYEKAIILYNEAFGLDPSAKITVYRLIHLYATTGKRAAGEDLLNFWLREHPDDMFVRNMYNTYWRSGR